MKIEFQLSNNDFNQPFLQFGNAPEMPKWFAENETRLRLVARVSFDLFPHTPDSLRVLADELRYLIKANFPECEVTVTVKWIDR